MDLEAFDWLRTDEGQALLERATAVAGEDPLRAQTALRRDATPERVAVAMSQAQLRRRAMAKFGDLAARMYFTPDGLEQATRLAVAEHRAARLVAFGAGTVIDLGCGIGGDLIAAARAGLTAAGVDLDPERVAVARANLAALDLPGAVSVADATAVDHSPFDVAFADPARRGGRGRALRGWQSDAEGWTPPWSFVLSLLERDACVKVAPGIPHDLVPTGVEMEFVSDGGEVKEAALWAGRLATVRRRATVIGDGGLATLTDEDDPGADVRQIGEFLYEPDGAVIRAGLVTAVAAGVGGGLLDEQIAYVTSDASYRTPFARGYRVLEELPYRERALRAALRERGIGRLTIKKRGVGVVPEELRRRLSLQGPNEATIVLTRVADQGTCLLVRPF
ncbi:class I SAM-dependent methyltransferase [Nocardioides sp.]|uniref:class I SAM-dependent methyltransferase n=1 Tax=Nocardioides sp. TaxID=35761 RepID=UPI002CA1D7EF|nr:class I SAM-dependent methyltransferase [Nocardioides sp.]HVX53965.1 class I SAM-dependent methyltransferase [Nocardioides sp.]